MGVGRRHQGALFCVKKQVARCDLCPIGAAGYVAVSPSQAMHITQRPATCAGNSVAIATPVCSVRVAIGGPCRQRKHTPNSVLLLFVRCALIRRQRFEDSGVVADNLGGQGCPARVALGARARVLRLGGELVLLKPSSPGARGVVTEGLR